jgi:hypothetical protein
MTLIELLKQLAEKYPEKWKTYSDGLYQIDSKRLYARYFEHLSTEDCDRILAEHGMVMGVTWILDDDGLTTWKGEFGCKEDSQVLEIISREEKREATEATFLAALEYILKECP